MIASLSTKMASFLINKNYIPCEHKKIAIYGSEIVISTIINFASILLVSCLFGTAMEALIFTVCFVTIRQVVGGYHAKTSKGCIAFLVTSFTIIMIIYKVFTGIQNYCFFGLLTVANLIVIYIFAPVDNPNKKIEKSEVKKLKNFGLILAVAFSTASLLLYVLRCDYWLMIHLTLCFVSILLVKGYLKYKKNN